MIDAKREDEFVIVANGMLGYDFASSLYMTRSLRVN